MTPEAIKLDVRSLKIYSKYLNLQQDRGDYTANCPFHDDSTPSFRISNKDGKYLWNCFGCLKGGSIIDFVMLKENLDFKNAVRKIEKLLLDEVDRVFKPVSMAREYLTIDLDQYGVLERRLAENKEALDFLESRGINGNTAKMLHFGYRRELSKRGSADNSNSARGYVAIPTIRNNRVTSIEYRSFPNKSFARETGMETAIRFMEMVNEFESTYVVEGSFDAAILIQSGFRAVSIPNAGYKITPAELERLRESDKVILAGDTDQPGTESMNRLWNILGDGSFFLKWPAGMKDANQTFLEYCKSDSDRFKELVKSLTKRAESEPIPNVYSLPESMNNGDRLRLEDHPHRFHAPWKSVDNMIRVLPGGVIGITGTNTGTGKSTFAMNLEVYEAMKYGEVVLNYSGELSPDEYSNIVAAHILGKDRTQLQRLDYQLAAKKLGDIKFYTGYNPDLNTITPVLDLIELAIKKLGATRVILDHLHYFVQNESNVIEAQSAAMQRIKNMAQKYGIIFLVLSQPRKANQNLKGKPIHITDAKGSEAVVSTCDAFLALHREMAKISGSGEVPKDPYVPETMVQLLKGRSLGGGNSFSLLYCLGEKASFFETIGEPENNSLNNLFKSAEDVL